VNSVLSQSFTNEEFEVVVVNDSGRPLAVEPWQDSPRVRVINTNRRERSVARNTGAAVATGRYLHFLDDDDWLRQDAWAHLWRLSHETHAAWLYGESQLVQRDGKDLIRLHHGFHGNCFLPAMSGEWIPLQSSLIERRLFHRLGGFSPVLAGPEDIDLLRRVCLHADVAETPHVIASIERGDAGSTTDYRRHPALSRWAREAILADQAAFARMKATARSSFWCGRLLRIYATSAAWNLRRRHLAVAASRLTYGAAAILLAGIRILSVTFWRGVLRRYESPTFARGMKARSAVGMSATPSRKGVAG
jgi:glycosyltransferase involved in cell wall biosynthesis